MVGLLEQNPMQNLDPKEVQMFKEGYQLVKQFVYQEPVFDAIVEGVQGNPVNTITGSLVTAMMRVQEKTGQFSLVVAAAIGISMLDDIAESLEQAGVMENTPELQQELLQAAIVLWLQSNKYPDEDIARELQSIGAPPEMIQQILQGGQQEMPQQTQAPQQGEMQPPQQGGGLLQRGM